MILLPLLLTTSTPATPSIDAAAASISDTFATEVASQEKSGSAAKTAGLDYDYVELDYLWTDLDDADEQLNGFELIGSVGFASQAFVQASFSRQSDDVDLDRIRVGVGYHAPIAANVDGYGLLSLAHDEVSDSGDDFDDFGFAAEAGVRALVTPKFEVSTAAEWVDVHDSDFGLRFGARYSLTDSLSLTGRAEFISDDTTFGAGLRLQF